MKKRIYSYILLMVFVLVAAVLQSQPSAAQEFGSVTINRSPTEGGSVNVTPPAGPYEIGAYVTLEAVAAAGYAFSGWSDTLGAVSGNETSTDFFVAGNHVITANFTKTIKTCFTLTATADPSAGGTVTLPVDESCPEPGQFAEGSTPTITASANNGYKFFQWTGSPAGTIDPSQSKEPSIVITMDQNRIVTANFDKVCQPLTLSTNGEGAAITANPIKGTCPNDYEFKAGESTTLTAAPAPGWKITSWDIGATNVPTADKSYNLIMPALPFGEGLLVQVHYEERATFGFASDLPHSVAEDAGTIVINVIRAENTLSNAAAIQFTTVDGKAKAGKDYIFKSGDLTFAKGQDSATISIPILEDNIKEGPEAFSVELSKTDPNIKLGITSAVVQIIDNEGEPTIRFEEPVYTVGESEITVEVAVTVSPLPESGDVIVDFKTEDGTAGAGEDYKAIAGHTFRISRNRNQTRDTVKITLTPDDLDEPDEETVRLILSNPSNNVILPADSEGVLKILDDDDPPAVAFSERDYFIQKSSSDSASISVSLSEISGQEVKVDYGITLERTGQTTEGTLGFAAGVQRANLDFPISSAVIDDIFLLRLSNPQNAELRTDDPEFPNAARLFVLSTGIEDCHELKFTYSGFGQAPAAVGKTSSLGCPGGHYVAGDRVNISAQPDKGWYVAAWTGTIDDENSSLENAVEMPDFPITVNAAYRMPIFFAVVNKAQVLFNGPNEEEPNGLFSQANGPILLNKDYHGTFSDDEDLNDLYYFQLDKQTRVLITLEDIPLGRDYDLVLYDDGWIDGEFIAESRRFDNNPEEITERLQPGRYFIQVYAGESEPSSAKYRLRVANN